MVQEPSVPVFDKWVKAINAHDINALMRLYAGDVMMIPAFSTYVRRNKNQVKDLYHDLFDKDDLQIVPFQVSTQMVEGLKVDSGQYKVKWKSQGFEETNDVRFSFVIQKGKVISHHSSLEPSKEISLAHPEAYDDDYVE